MKLFRRRKKFQLFKKESKLKPVRKALGVLSLAAAVGFSLKAVGHVAKAVKDVTLYIFMAITCGLGGIFLLAKKD